MKSEPWKAIDRKRLLCMRSRRCFSYGHTRDNIASIHRILVLDEAEAVHEFDLGDLSGAMGIEVGLDISLGSIAREVAQVQAGGGDFRHNEVLEMGDVIAINKSTRALRFCEFGKNGAPPGMMAQI
jgi:hypothetical protein